MSTWLCNYKCFSLTKTNSCFKFLRISCQCKSCSKYLFSWLDKHFQLFKGCANLISVLKINVQNTKFVKNICPWCLTKCYLIIFITTNERSLLLAWIKSLLWAFYGEKPQNPLKTHLSDTLHLDHEYHNSMQSVKTGSCSLQEYITLLTMN